jgi:hypothetical protein
MGKFKSIVEGRLDKLSYENVSDRHVIRLGQPLPNNGTCAHNKNSAKWLRFTCCGKVFP